MTDRQVDVAIVGLGLAGTTLAWQLLAHDLSLCLIDAPLAGAASRVAAGLITPVTGKALKPQPDFHTLHATATAFYDRIATHLGTPVLEARAALRRLDTEQELAAWARLRESNHADCQPAEAAPWLFRGDAATIIRLPGAARLNTRRYLDASREHFGARGLTCEALLDPTSLRAGGGRIHAPSVGVSASRLIFCCGWQDRSNPWFDGLDWRPAKGQILRLETPDLPPATTLHGNGIWLTSDVDGESLCGATYEWEALDDANTADARKKLLAKLTDLVPFALRVIDQQAGVRPIVAGRQPVAGFSAAQPRIGLLNGLGSKGALLAPTVARELTAAIVNDAPISARFDLQRRMTR